MEPTTVRQQAERAKAAATVLATLSHAQKDRALAAIAEGLRANVSVIGRANAVDLDNARAAGVSAAMLDRLEMGPKVTESTAAAVEYVMSLEDPIGSRTAMVRRPNGLQVAKQRIPLGVIGMVYESRPNVTVDAAALCLKSGNSVLLRGGKEAIETNRALGEVIGEALASSGVPKHAVQIVSAHSRDTIKELISLDQWIDLVIPRGGEGLIRFVTEHSRVPVVQHFKGVCHLYVDAGSDVSMAVDLVINGKVQRPSVCNALECLLVHAAAAPSALPEIGRALAKNDVEVRGCQETMKYIPGAKLATQDDWGCEFLAKILAVRVVADLDAALSHVRQYGSRHSEAICTNSYANAQRWLNDVDASCVLVNASTRFNDGGELGLGAEIGISTSKLHAYGPMGLTSLTSEKWVVLGEGQVRT
jgi:glutamate-5-semialdehyde dehydrogenase